MAKRCTKCWSRKCDSGPACARNRLPRSRTAEYKRAWARQKAAKAGRVCRKGHVITRPVQNCPVCVNEREKRRKQETKEALAPRPKPEPTPAPTTPIAPFALSPSELAMERDAWKQREAERFEAALQRAKAQQARWIGVPTQQDAA